MANGLWNPDLNPLDWFDASIEPEGWFDPDYLTGGPDFAVATKQGQSTAAVAGVSADATAATSQAQLVGTVQELNDRWFFAGEVFVRTGDASSFALEPVWQATPFNYYSPLNLTLGAPPAGATVTVTTAQAQSATASGSVGDTASVTTSQAQSSAAAASAINPGEVQVTTRQAQTVAAAASISIDAAVSASQAQSTAATGTVASAVAAATSQAQTTTGGLFAPWVLAQTTFAEASTSGTTLTSSSLTYTAGNVIAVYATWGLFPASATTCAVTSSYGDTFTAGTRLLAGSETNGNKGEWFYCVPSAGGTGTITMTVSAAEGFRSLRVMELRPPAGLTAAFVEEVTKATVGFGDTVGDYTSNTFHATDNSMVVVAEHSRSNALLATVETFTDGFTTNPRPTTTFNTLSGYKAIGSAVNATTTYDTNAGSPSERAISTLVFSASLGTVSCAVTTSQAQSTVALSAGAATAQAQSAAAAATVSITATASTAQAQSAAVQASAGDTATGTTSQAQSAQASGSVQSAVAVATSQAQSAAASAAVSQAADVATSQAQSAAATAAVSADATGATSQAQSTTATTASALDTTGATSQAQTVAAAALAAFDLAGSTSQAQSAQAQAAISDTASVATSQGQTAAAQAELSISTAVQTQQAQTVEGRARREADGAVETSQAQSSTAAAALAITVSASTRQGQSSAGLVGVSQDSSASTAQAQSTQFGRLVVGITCTVTTGQSRQTCTGQLEQFIPQLGTLAGRMRLYPAVGGSVAFEPAVAVRDSRLRTAVRGEPVIEPAVTAAGGARIRPAASGHTETRLQ